ncbi:toll/interleukin-1 receptor domain-containing protein [Nodosilinea nodulosa]|uniref:toll/interleukin-1 receptor domain-containing protein n=1 Tax=Nodosilinea nodulosa TaxID=416001 RepID=UPI0003134D0F|nr:toll/interleukin-1 receptor domain-containing protein [Nodosilinea nodulosa]
MGTIFLSYALKDGQAAAARLKTELEQAGFQIWRDIEAMEGGKVLKTQLRAALRAVDAVVVLLTPAAVVSEYVEWEWETALTLEKLIIPLLISPCEVPAELKQLHYRNLTTEQDYVMGIISLIRDLNSVLANDGSNREPFENPQQNKENSDRSISVGGNSERSILISGDGNIAGSSNNVTYQFGKNNTKIDKAKNIRIGDNYND